MECLHESQNSKVFKVSQYDKRMQWSQTLAMKVLNSKNSFQESVKEFESLQAVKSPYCVTVQNLEIINGQYVLLLEYIEGVNLKKLISSHCLSKQEINYLADKVYQGLCALKASGLTHGDLSLSNVLVTKEGKIKLIDYGLSNLCGKYTPNFVAPEVLYNRQYSFEADLFALGKVIKILGGSEGKYQPLLNEVPRERFFPKDSIKRSSQKSLAHKVQQVLIGQGGLSTKIMDQELACSKVPRFYGLLLFSFLWVGSSSPLLKETPINHSYLSVTSLSWSEVNVNGKFMSYSPFFLEKIPSGYVNLNWMGPRGKGQRTLTLRPGEHKVLRIE